MLKDRKSDQCFQDCGSPSFKHREEKFKQERKIFPDKNTIFKMHIRLNEKEKVLSRYICMPTFGKKIKKNKSLDRKSILLA